MQNEKTITFDKLPEAVGYLTEQVIELKKMVSELKPSSSEKRVLIEIEDACRGSSANLLDSRVVQCEQPKLEIFVVPKTVCISLENLDFVVDTLDLCR